MVHPQKFQSLLIIYLALQHCLQNPNAKFQYRDVSHQMTRYILAHMPYFCRPGHKCGSFVDQLQYKYSLNTYTANLLNIEDFSDF